MSYYLDPFGITEPDIDAIIKRANLGTLTDDDHRTVTDFCEAVSDALPDMLTTFHTFDDIFGTGTTYAAMVTDLLPMSNDALAGWGFEARVNLRPSYRSEPIPGAELGGTPRNPEADVIDEIDRLVEWQMKDGEK